MSQGLTEHLTFLYGAETAGQVETRLLGVLRRHGWDGAERSLPAPRSLPLTQHDALLITYGDQVRQEGERPLATLAGFLGRHASDVVSGVHVLPFYPYSSDDGFSVIDYLAVDPALGTWADVAALGSRFEMMFDAVFNHCSAKSEW